MATEQPQQRQITEDDLIDYVFFTLYTNLDKNEMHFEEEIIAPTKLPLDAKQIDHLREVVITTGFVKPSVGFTKRGFVYLNANGIQIMKTYKTYSAYSAAANNNAGLGQFITTEGQAPSADSSDDEVNPKQKENYDNDWAD